MMIIYKVTNIINDKVYIGLTTKTLGERKSKHIYDAFNKNSNLIFHRTLRKYGEVNFKWEVIDNAINEQEMKEKEIYWIDFYDSFGKKGYNMTKGGDGTLGVKMSDEHKRKLIEINKNKSYSSRSTFISLHNVKELFSNESFNDSERVSIMYISSFVGYSGYLMTNNNIKMDKKLFKKYVKIADKYNAVNNFYNKLIESGIILMEGNSLKWNSSLSFKGREPLHFCKMYDQTLQELYEGNKPKSLSVVFRLLPYVNKFTNELCRIVDKPSYSADDLYSPQEVAELLGIIDPMDKKNFVRRALKIKVGNEFVFMVSKVGNVAKVTINPKLVWMNGTAPDHTLLNLFELAKK